MDAIVASNDFAAALESADFVMLLQRTEAVDSLEFRTQATFARMSCRTTLRDLRKSWQSEFRQPRTHLINEMLRLCVERNDFGMFSESCTSPLRMVTLDPTQSVGATFLSRQNSCAAALVFPARIYRIACHFAQLREPSARLNAPHPLIFSIDGEDWRDLLRSVWQLIPAEASVMGAEALRALTIGMESQFQLHEHRPSLCPFGIRCHLELLRDVTPRVSRAVHDLGIEETARLAIIVLRHLLARSSGTCIPNQHDFRTQYQDTDSAFDVELGLVALRPLILFLRSMSSSSSLSSDADEQTVESLRTLAMLWNHLVTRWFRPHMLIKGEALEVDEDNLPSTPEPLEPPLAKLCVRLTAALYASIVGEDMLCVQHLCWLLHRQATLPAFLRIARSHGEWTHESSLFAWWYSNEAHIHTMLASLLQKHVEFPGLSEEMPEALCSHIHLTMVAELRRPARIITPTSDNQDDDDSDEDYVYEGDETLYTRDESSSSSSEDEEEVDAPGFRSALSTLRSLCADAAESPMSVPVTFEDDSSSVRDTDGDDESEERPQKRARFMTRKESEDDITDVEIVKVIASCMHIEGDAAAVFNADGARTVVKQSQLLPGQRGVFAREAIAARQLVTWYTGRVFLTTSSLARHQLSKPAVQRDYVFEVAYGGRIRYFIDGSEPDARFGGDRPCTGAFINHHPEACNTEFEVVKVSGGSGGVLAYRAAIYATRDITPGEELLIHYGDKFHQSLVDAGLLVS